MDRKIVSAIVCALLMTPSFAFAFPFGGQINQIIFCYNDAIYANVGPPRGGPFIWTPSTRTYRFGPPMRSGQWLLGLAAPPYYCIVSKQPIIVWSGILMTMEGSSGAAAPAYSPRNTSSSALNGLTGSGGAGGSTAGSGSGAGVPSHVLISEVYPQADASHGGLAQYDWVELFNPTSASVDVSHWVVKTAQSSQTIPNGTSLPAGGYIVVTGTSTVRTLWTIPQSAQVMGIPNAFGNGFVSAGDEVLLDTDAGANIDAISWGSDTRAFSPSVTVPVGGHALIRTTLARDTDTKQDWVDTSAPTPGR